MRTSLAVVSACLAFSGSAFASPPTKVEQGPISVEAKMIAADRSGQKQFPKLSAKNTDPKEEFTVKGRVRLFDKSEQTLRECPFMITLYANKSSTFDLRECTEPIAPGFELLVDVIEQAAPLEAPPF